MYIYPFILVCFHSFVKQLLQYYTLICVWTVHYQGYIDFMSSVLKMNQEGLQKKFTRVMFDEHLYN